MKRALALVTAMVALMAISTGSASAQAPCNQPAAYCPASSSPGTTAPTVDPPAPTSSDKTEAAATIADVVDLPVVFKTQIGSALVYTLDKSESSAASDSGSSGSSSGTGTTPSGLWPIGVLALTSATGAKIETDISFKLANGKSLTIPSPSKTIGPGGSLVVKVRLTKAQLAQLVAAGGGTASIEITVTDQYGTHKQTVKVAVDPPAKAKKAKKKSS